MKKALFLDRDGVINEDISYLYQANEFRFIPGIFPLCRTAQEKGYCIIVVTNQSGIARGYYAADAFWDLTAWMCQQFQQERVNIAKVYCCPFHPEKGIGLYRRESEDRKPNPGMILKARENFSLDLKASILIGDKDSDMAAGRSAGIGTLLLLPGRYGYEAAGDVRILQGLQDAEAYLF